MNQLQIKSFLKNKLIHKYVKVNEWVTTWNFTECHFLKNQLTCHVNEFVYHFLKRKHACQTTSPLTASWGRHSSHWTRGMSSSCPRHSHVLSAIRLLPLPVASTTTDCYRYHFHSACILRFVCILFVELDAWVTSNGVFHLREKLFLLVFKKREETHAFCSSLVRIVLAALENKGLRWDTTSVKIVTGCVQLIGVVCLLWDWPSGCGM